MKIISLKQILVVLWAVPYTWHSLHRATKSFKVSVLCAVHNRPKPTLCYFYASKLH